MILNFEADPSMIVVPSSQANHVKNDQYAPYSSQELTSCSQSKYGSALPHDTISIRPTTYTDCNNTSDEESIDTMADISDENIGPYDIICGRNSESFNHIGNRRFRITVSLHLPGYTSAGNRQKRSEVITAIIKILKNEAGARFLKKKGDRYVELNRREMRQKVTHALRDMQFHKQNKQENPKNESEEKTVPARRGSFDKSVHEMPRPTVHRASLIWLADGLFDLA
jgi:hypothetical protein